MKTDSTKSSARPSEAVIIIRDRTLNDYEAKLVKLWNEGKSAGEIAKELHVTRNTIMGKIWRLRNKGVGIEKHERTNTRGKDKKPRVRRSPAPLLDLIFKRQKEEKIGEVIKHEEPFITNSLNIRFKDLRNHSCRYVINDGRPENFIFCGAPKERGAYCEAHASICYTPPRLPVRSQHNPSAPQRYYR